MHDRPRGRQTPDAIPDNLLARRESVALADILSVAKRYSGSMLLCVLLGLGAAVAYLVTEDPLYTATTKILIEPSVPQIPSQQPSQLRLDVDSAQVESQLALLRSERITTMVVKELGLYDDPEFTNPPERDWQRLWEALFGGTFFEWPQVEITILEGHTDSLQEVTSWLFGGAGSQSAAERHPAAEQEDSAAASLSAEAKYQRVRRAVGVFHANYHVWREGISYVVVLSYKARDPEKASQIANAIAAAYLRDQLEAKVEAQSRGSLWMESRIEELREQMNNATQAVQSFRAGHDYRISGTPDETTLEELQATAHTYRQLYESFLNAYTASVVRQSYPVPDARVITPASPPLEPSHPRTKMVLTLGSLLGMMAAIGTALLRHGLDRSIRTPSDLREQLGVECLGQLPRIRRGWSGRGVYEGLLSAPSSTFAECVRGIRTAISLPDSAGEIRCLGITSSAPGEGKTSLTSNLAALYSLEGKRTLAVDADICTAQLSRRFGGRHATRGIVQAFQNVRTARASIVDSGAGFDLLPAGPRGPSGNGAFVGERMLPDESAAERMLALLKALGKSYDIVIVDLPPISVAADGLAVSTAFDGVVVVAEWSKTPVDLLEETCRMLRQARSVLLGVVISKVVGKVRYGYEQYARSGREAKQVLRLVARRG
jgi:uncharacterized protein involved in exopolysaccharide biosynthesis/Mrp family chromosome partitioning ATPase